ncbi:MAG: hypothetical protein C0592_03975 [Marinilabiliales bacterium]|nr:MAG: hypothetical protein C0592_03975 [Marinilabiliales bacterium]
MKKLLIPLVLVFAFSIAKADSPLTSTDFYLAYMDNEMVLAAQSANGLITDEIMEFLWKKNPVDEKMAVINALGWTFEGQSNYSKYREYLDKHGMKKKQRKAENLLALAYLKALDNYFECTEALAIAKQALSMNPDSYTFNIIHGLIKAQVEFDYSWCNVYKATDDVRKNTSLDQDMRGEAITIIFEYMDLYAGDCE